LDEATQEKLFVAFRDLVYPSLLFLLNHHEWAEDAVQDAFIRAMQHGYRILDNSNMIAWLKKIARNTAYDIIRKNKKYRPFSDLDTASTIYESDSNYAVSSVSVEKAVETMIRNEQLLQTLNLMKWEDRIVLFLRYIEDMPNKDIALLLGIPGHVVNKRLERAKKKLANQFIRRWGEDDNS
jgi:RNA polymerase sigma-70 factor (ECF subfamily)